MIIGITGNSGSGKTTLSKLLKEEYNAEIIDADEVVCELSMQGKVYYNEILKEFGEDILLQNGQIDKSKLAKIIFENNEKREKINNLTFKYVVEEINRRVNATSNKTIIIDAPLLIESKLNKICDVVISTIADKSIKLERICKRDNISKEQALSRIGIQAKDEFYMQNSNCIIVNNNEVKLEEQIKGLKILLESKMIKNKECVITQNGNLRILQFKKLLEYKNIIHAFTLKTFDFGSNDTYAKIKEEADNNYKNVCKLLNLDSKNIIRPYQTHTNNIKDVCDEVRSF